MTNAAIIDTADALVSFLNEDHSWSQSFTAARAAIDFNDELADDGLHVDVAIGRSAEGEPLSGDVQEDSYLIDVGVRKKCDVSDTSVTDPLWLLVQEIRDVCLNSRLTDHEAAVCVGWQQKPTYYRSHARKFRQFTSVVTLEFSISRDL